ncbi:hypothetical protein [Sulfurimonas sp. HSL3-7]|uniref:hypothetical protein n=1 Tax=Sulfonitrofixus jiaomeiensis TaxID=3131938 RepID=UPI0031F802FB
MKLMSAIAVSAAAVLFTAGCGGGGGSDGTTEPSLQTGYFMDSGVEGVTYTRSGDGNGTTGASGAFGYLSGETVTFSIGGLTIGQAAGSPVITPLDFAPNATTLLDPEVNNIVRLLLALDENTTKSGIQISDATIQAAAAWTTPDYNLSESQFYGSVSSALGADAPATLPTAAQAETHFLGTLECAYSGAYIGRWNTSDDSGDWGVLVQADNTVIARAKNDSYTTFMDLTSGSRNTVARTLSFSGGLYTVDPSDPYNPYYDGSVSATASFADADHLDGTATVSPDGISVALTANRIGSSPTAKYRFTGRYTDTTGFGGLFTMDIDADGKVTGLGYDIEMDEKFPISGLVEGTTLTFTIDDTTTGGGSIYLDNGTLNASWSDPSDGSSGSVSGTGCQLN